MKNLPTRYTSGLIAIDTTAKVTMGKQILTSSRSIRIPPGRRPNQVNHPGFTNTPATASKTPARISHVPVECGILRQMHQSNQSDGPAGYRDAVVARNIVDELVKFMPGFDTVALHFNFVQLHVESESFHDGLKLLEA